MDLSNSTRFKHRKYYKGKSNEIVKTLRENLKKEVEDAGEDFLKLTELRGNYMVDIAFSSDRPEYRTRQGLYAKALNEVEAILVELDAKQLRTIKNFGIF